ncbi:MAG: hypothetical protein IT260_04655 [Saprospiraceae bacterium]|nr:hypothetical protein [Saprospiraceae bacterium]
MKTILLLAGITVLACGPGARPQPPANASRDSLARLSDAQPAADTVACCEYFNVAWAEADSMEARLPPLAGMEDEQRESVARALKNFKAKRAEIRRHEALRRRFGFPESCIFFEYALLKSDRLRAIAIVVENARFTVDLDEFYTCPAESTGHGFVCGAIRYVLLDPQQNTVLDTLPDLRCEEYRSPWCHELPFSICQGYTYRSNGDHEREGLARILTFSDFDRDGLAAEFPLFEYGGSCGFNAAVLVGYDARQDALRPLSFSFAAAEEDWENRRKGQDSTYQAVYDWLPNPPLRALLQQDTLRYFFSIGHGSEIAELYTIWFERSAREYRGTLRIVSADSLFAGTVPFFGTGGGHGY